MIVEKLPNQSKQHAEFKVTVPENSFIEHCATIIGKIAKEADIEGYEKGTAPISVVEEKFKDKISNITAQDLIFLKAKEIITQEKLSNIFPPNAKIIQLEKGKDLIFQIKIEQKPVFEIMDFSSIALINNKVVISNEDIDKGIQKISKDQNLDPKNDPEKFINFFGGKEKNMDEIRIKLRSDIEQKTNSICNKMLKTKLMKILVENHNFTIPESLVNHEYSLLAQQNLPKDYNPKEMPAPEMMIQGEQKEKFQKMAKDRAHLGIILSEIAGKKNIRIEKEEVNKAIFLEASRHKGKEQQFLDFYKNNPAAFQQFQIPLLQNKVLDFILLKAKIDTREISLEEFKGLL